MPTYEYECETCGLRFEVRQSIKEEPLSECPECKGKVHRVLSGGMAFILKGADGTEESRAGCSLDNIGKTCCGRNERCDKPPCGDK
jgi:putative FmdB family regulatory protein